MIPPPDQHLAELFVRYWDSTLSGAESVELQSRLASDAVARESFEFFCLQAVAASEHLKAAAAPEIRPSARANFKTERRWSRRQLLGYIGTGVAAGVAVTLLGKQYWFGKPTTEVRLTAMTGDVTVRSPNGGVVAAEGPVPTGSIVSTNGANASAVLSYPSGTELALTGDSAVTVLEDGRKLSLLRGTATVHIPAQTSDSAPLTLSTTEASLSRLSGVVLTLGRVLNTTEVGVQSGRVSVVDAAGDPLEIVHTGECLTVRSDGKHRKTPIEPTPDRYHWDLTRPLPEGWNVGFREVAPDGPVVRPVSWFDPYHKAEMFQIRSDHQWARGFVRLDVDSVFHIKYWVDRPGPSQFCMCVRTDSASSSDTGMLECNAAFVRARPREWQTLSVRVADMFDNKHAPKFRGVLVPFLMIFNTYKEDLGLRIADLRVG